MPALAPGLVAWVTGVALGLAPAVPLVSRAKAPSVVVWPADGSARSSEVDADAVREAGFDPVAFESIANAIEAAHTRALEAERAGLDAVREGLDRAQKKYLGMDFGGMLTELAAIERASAALLATESYCGTLWEVEFRQGLALLSRGDADAAADRFRFAAALDPGRRPAGDLYGPDVAQAFLAAVEAQKADVAQPVRIAVEPSDALVAVDCRVLESKTARLAPGLHVVRVEAPGHPAVAEVIDTRSDRVDVTAPRDASLSATEAIGSLPAGTSLDRDGATWSGAIAAAVEGAGADAYVWLGADASRFAGQVVADGKRGRRRVADSRAEAVELALADLGANGLIVMARPVVADGKRGPVENGDDTKKKKGIATKWWFWTILGGIAVAAIAVGLGVGLTRPEDPERLRLYAR